MVYTTRVFTNYWATNNNEPFLFCPKVHVNELGIFIPCFLSIGLEPLLQILYLLDHLCVEATSLMKMQDERIFISTNCMKVQWSLLGVPCS